MTDKQCSSCGGFCGRGGCKRENVPTKIMAPNLEEVLNSAGFYRREWVGLTDEDVSKTIGGVIGFNSCVGWEEDFARAIEAKLKEKNGFRQ